jgi:hypothetical protein
MPGFSWIMTISGHGPASGQPKYARIVALRLAYSTRSALTAVEMAIDDLR